jgi:hypothetical protein
LLDGASEHVGDNASTFVLGLAGIKPETAPTISLNIEVKAGYRCRLDPRGILAAP